jgi:hypothetical protein
MNIHKIFIIIHYNKNMTLYTDFMKIHLKDASLKALPQKEKMAAVAKMWAAHKSGAIPIKMPRTSKKTRGGLMTGAGLEQPKGSGFISEALGALGL